MNPKLKLILCMFVLLVPGILAVGTVQTSILQPPEVILCGDYQQYTTITAGGIINKINVTLTSVTATLYFSGSPGLNFVTSQNVNLGDIGPLSSSSINPSWVLQCYTPHQGIYLAYVNYSSANGYTGSSIDEITSLITIHENTELYANGTIIEGTPVSPGEEDIPVISDNTPTIVVTTNKDSICRGSLDHDEAYESMDFVFYGTEKIHNYTFTSPIAEGQHSVYVKCKDSFNNIMQNSVEIRFIIDSKAPGITILTPLSITSEYTNLNVSADEDSECRYSEEDESFNSMTEFEISEERFFSVLLANLSQGENDYYIICKDIVGNEAEKKINIKVEMQPTCQISLSDSSPVKEGIIKITLIPSKQLRAVPSLSYSFTDTPTFSRQISLVKYDGFYIGYMIMEEYTMPKIGVFSFQGYDLNGVIGTEITEGKNFIVDTIKPEAVTSFDISTDSQGNIKLKWYYEGEKEHHFNIYRSASPGVNYIHLYDSTINDEYTDDNIEEGIEYFYRIAAVDEASNIGILSAEKSITAAKSSYSDIPKEDIPKYETLREYNKTLRELEKIEIDINWAEANLNEEKTKESAVEELNLIKKVMDAKSQISKIKNQYENIDLNAYTDSDLRSQISTTTKLIENLEQTTPHELIVEKKTDYLQSTTESDIDEVVNEITRNLNYSAKQIKQYKEKNYEILDKVKVSSEIKTLTIEYLSGDTDNRIIVRKEVYYESPESLEKIKIVELIPKTIAADLGSVDVRTPDYVIIKEDPIIAWNIDELSYDKFEIKYLILSDDFSESAKNTKTVVLFRQDLIKPDSSLVTGFSVFFSKVTPFGILQTLGMFVGIALVIGLLLYYLVYVKEIDLKGVYFSTLKNFTSKKQEKPSPEKEQKTENVQKLNIDYNLLTSPVQYFYLSNGDVIRSLAEFFDVLANIDDSTFNSHVNEQKNDFANWLRATFNLSELAGKIENTRKKQDMISILNKYKT
ncbi:hypothetical protein JXB41_02010 [Candidatus Woesearchaeota archaeon]|nr:hypothetical protein [Candidatus Woesearchaeota archaeon]